MGEDVDGARGYVVRYLIISLVLIGIVVFAIWLIAITGEWKLPRIRRVKAGKDQKALELSQRREDDERHAVERLEARHQAHLDDLEQFDLLMEALVPHEEHKPKNRLSAQTGCYHCEKERKRDAAHWEYMVGRI